MYSGEIQRFLDDASSKPRNPEILLRLGFVVFVPCYFHVLKYIFYSFALLHNQVPNKGLKHCCRILTGRGGGMVHFRLLKMRNLSRLNIWVGGHQGRHCRRKQWWATSSYLICLESTFALTWQHFTHTRYLLIVCSKMIRSPLGPKDNFFIPSTNTFLYTLPHKPKLSDLM